MRLVDLARHALQTWLSRFQRYRELTAWRRRQRIDSTSWLHPDIRALVPERQPTAAAIDAVLKRSIESFPLPLYLRVEDRNASAHSVEARVPFLDHDFVRGMIGNNQIDKLAFRHMAQDYLDLPAEITHCSKYSTEESKHRKLA